MIVYRNSTMQKTMENLKTISNPGVTIPMTRSKTDVPCVALQNVQADSQTLRTICRERRIGPGGKALTNVKRLVTLAVVAQLLNTITLERKVTNAAPTQGARVTNWQQKQEAILGAQRAI